MAERFYVNCPLGPGPVVLQGPEAHHLANVRRFRPGQQVYLFNGDGHEYLAEITDSDRRQVELRIVQSAAVSRELPFLLSVACPLPKGDRGQFLIEKLTELGATSYVPLRTERSVIHPGESRAEKLRRYVIEASKQCGRNRLMHIEPLQSWEEYVARTDLPAQRVLGHPGGIPRKFDCLGQDVAIIVGPEGGLMPDELELARNKGWQVVDLGPRILRIETAAIALASLIAATV